jgi:hypothetical protein
MMATKDKASPEQARQPIELPINEEHPAVRAARQREDRPTERVVTLSTGYRAVLKPVSVALIDTVAGMTPRPKVPMWANPDKPTQEHLEGRPEPNPADPQYLADLEAATRKRNQAINDALILFGVKLLDPLPPDAEWVPMLEMLGIDVPDDPLARELCFKRYVAVAAPDLVPLASLSGMGGEELKEAVESFRSK